MLFRSIEVVYLLGGLAPDSDLPMPEQMKLTIAGYWQTIQDRVLGTQFNYDFWTKCQPRRSTYPSCRAVLAAKAGAKYVSPFIGRLDDIGQDGMSLIKEIKTIFSNYDFKTQILVASVRHPMHVVEAAKIGADVVTLPPAVLDKMLKHPLTDIGLKNFLADWEKLKAENPDIRI